MHYSKILSFIAGLSLSLLVSCSFAPVSWDVEKGAGLWYQIEQDRLLYMEKQSLGQTTEYMVIIHAASARQDYSSTIYFKKDQPNHFVCTEDSRLQLVISGSKLTLSGVMVDGDFSEDWIGLSADSWANRLADYRAKYAKISAKPAATLDDVRQRTVLFELVNFLESVKLPKQ